MFCEPNEGRIIRLAIAATALFAALFVVAHAHAGGYRYRSHPESHLPRWYAYEHRHGFRYYDGPVGDFGTRVYGENGGTVHYGY